VVDKTGSRRLSWTRSRIRRDDEKRLFGTFYESINIKEENRMELIYDAVEYFQQGGPIMVPIVVLSALLWGLILERLVFFHRLEKSDREAGNTPMELNGRPLPPAATTGLCAPVIQELIRHGSGEAKFDQRILERYALRQKNRLQRSSAVLAALATAAPLLGLFGTVSGMINTFEAITFFGTGNAKALAAGISEALVTTQSGLLVGIPGLFMARLIQQRARRLNNRLEETVMAARSCLQ
jgi:biopolymer transport protein ExbB